MAEFKARNDGTFLEFTLDYDEDFCVSVEAYFHFKDRSFKEWEFSAYTHEYGYIFLKLIQLKKSSYFKMVHSLQMR